MLGYRKKCAGDSPLAFCSDGPGVRTRPATGGLSLVHILHLADATVHI